MSDTNPHRNVLAALVMLAFLAGLLAACTSTVVRKTSASATPARPKASAPRYGETARVKRGDTLYGIAFRNGLDVRDLAAWNGIGPPYTIYPGQTLRLYPRRSNAGSTGTAPAVSRTASVTPGRPAPVASAPRPAATDPPRAVRPAATNATPPAVSDITWRWPADGQVLNRFVAGEPTRQGIDITGDGGTPVRAAADGVVVYSGSGLVGYGELIIVKHSDAWLSAYGHNRSRMVNEGALVKAGEQIGVMGRTGAPRDMLHFEIRHNGKPVDPLAYLPKR